MQFDVSSSELLAGLVTGSGVLASKPVLPILEDYLFEIKGNELTITSSNLETTIISKVSVNADSDLRICIQGKTLLETLKALPSQPITFNIDEQSLDITMKSSYGEYKLVGDKTEDFPLLAKDHSDDKFTLPGKLIQDAISYTSFAASNDELRLAMTGVLMHLDFNKITFVGTDAQKLVKHTKQGLESEQTASLIIPKRSLMQIKNIVIPEEDVMISYGKEHLILQTEGIRIITKLIDSKFPDYNGVIPTASKNQLILNRSDFLGCLRRIAIYANKTTTQVVLNLEADQIKFYSQDLDFSNEAEETITCNYSGEPMTISFSAKVLIEMLGVLDSENVKFLLNDPGTPGLLMPEHQPEGEEVVMLVMPVMVAY